MPCFYFYTVYTVRLRYGTVTYRIIRLKEKYGPNNTSSVDRILPFCREKGDLKFNSRSELCFLLFHPNFLCMLFLFDIASWLNIGSMYATTLIF